MKEALRKAGAAFGGALMLGSTLVGAAFAGDVSKFYSDYAITDGAVAATIVIGEKAAAADVVAAIGISAEIGQKALKEATGAGKAKLTVASTATDGKTLDASLGGGMNKTSQTIYTLKATGLGIDTLSTLATGTVTGTPSDSTKVVKYQEIVTVNQTNALTSAFAAGKTVTSNTDSTNGYDTTVLEVGASGWLMYDLKFDEAVNVSTLVSKASEITFLGKKYIVASGSSSGELKLAGSGLSTTLSAGEEKEFSGKKVKLTTVQIGTPNVAYFDVTDAAGTTVSKSVQAGSSEVINGLNVYVNSAGQAYGAGVQTASASIILGGDTITLTSAGYYPKDTTDYLVTLTPGTGAGLSNINLKHNTQYTSANAFAQGTEKSFLGGLVSVKYLGQSAAATTNPIKVTAYPANLDASTDGSTEQALQITLPTKVVSDSDANADYADRVYVSLVAGTGIYNGSIYYRNTSTAPPAYRVVTQPTAGFDIGSGRTLLISAVNTSAGLGGYGPVVTLAEPTNGQYANYGKFEIQPKLDSSAGGTPKIDYVNFSTTRGGAGSVTDQQVAWTKSDNAFVSRTGYSTPYGTTLSSATTSEVVFALPTEERLVQLRIGSTKATTDTKEVDFGTTTKIGGVDVKVESAGVTGKVASGVPIGVAKLDSEVTAEDKKTNLVLVGGPVANSLTKELVTNGKLTVEITNDKPGAGKGIVTVVDNAFTPGKVALVVAGSDRSGTRAAAQLLQALAEDATKVAAGTATVTVSYVGAGAAPTVVA